MIYIGIDEAGRGPVIGPLVIGCFACTKSQIDFLLEEGVTDSKKLSAKRRQELILLIETQSLAHAIDSVNAEQITTYMRTGTNLNDIEAIHTAKVLRKVIDSLEVSVPKHVMIDLPSKNKEAYLEQLCGLLGLSYLANHHVTIDAEFKADLNHVYVGAASILAKVARDSVITQISLDIGESIGSGYPADPNTISFLEANWSKYPHIFRQEWESYKRLVVAQNEKSKAIQKGLGDF
jgi:ribonuclease HII